MFFVRQFTESRKKALKRTFASTLRINKEKERTSRELCEASQPNVVEQKESCAFNIWHRFRLRNKESSMHSENSVDYLRRLNALCSRHVIARCGFKFSVLTDFFRLKQPPHHTFSEK
mgnify:FL=1